LTATSGRIAIISTMIPIPPSHWVSCRHIRRACECRSKLISPITVAPVVVNPLIDSKSALTGSASVDDVPAPASTYGTAPTTAAISHASVTNTSASLGPRSGSGSTRSRATPAAATATIESAKTQMSSP